MASLTRGNTTPKAKFKGSGSGRPERVGKLVPESLLSFAFLVSFALPNLVFSGYYWFDTLHLWKWIYTMAPVGLLALVMGVQLLRYGAKRFEFSLDPFGVAWLFLIVLLTVQPFVVGMSSISTYVKEWFFFAVLFAVYVIAYRLCPGGRFHRLLLWGGNLNAATNVLFAELLIRNLNKGFPFILNVPGNYIGNTAQQEMFGLWTAMAVLNCLFLHLSYVGEEKGSASKNRLPLVIGNLFLLAVNSWGLWSSTARGAILSLLVAFFVLMLCLGRTGEWKAAKRAFKLFGVVVLFLALLLFVSAQIGTDRGNALVSKMKDMIENPTSVGSRISIWRVSQEVFLKKPVTGVGLGQYKWNFLDGQRLLFEKHPELRQDSEYHWQFTFWAHSEYIQWVCETGIVGGVFLLALALWWMWGFWGMLKRGERVPPEALWGCSMLFLLWFDALFSRPFHRIENAVWMSLAFALANRSILPASIKWTADTSDRAYRAFGGLLVVVSLYGFFFLAGGAIGDKNLYRSVAVSSSIEKKERQIARAESFLMSRDDAKEQRAYLNIQIGKITNDFDRFSDGIKELYEAFQRRPSSKLLFELLGYGRQLGSKELLEALARYIDPGTMGIGASGEILP